MAGNKGNPGKSRPTVRAPATKFAHLQKKMQKQVRRDQPRGRKA